MPATTAFDIIEQLCASGKGSDERKEDRLVITGDFIAVVDGATSSGPIGGRPGGIVAADAVAGAIAALPADADAAAFEQAATAAVAAAIGSAAADPTAMPPSASVVVWSRARNEIWRIGDCLYRIDGEAYPGAKLIDDVAYAYRCAVVKARLRLGLTDAARERAITTMDQPFRPLVLLQHAFLNLDDADEPLAYGAVCGRPVPQRFIEVTPVGTGREIVLASDGFLAPTPTLAEGLAAIAAIRAADPLMIHATNGSRPFPVAGDFFDDTTYVRFRLN